MNNFKDELTDANKKWGYTFGCEGVVSLIDAGELLGVPSKNTVKDYADKGYIRIGKHKASKFSKVVICRRSINEYLDSLET